MTKLIIYKACPLSPTSIDELKAYFYYVEYRRQLSVNDIVINDDPDWEGTEEQRAIVHNHSLWSDFEYIWAYAEKGLNAEEVKNGVAHALGLLIEIHRFIGYGEVELVHDGSFGCESISIREAGIKVVYKFLARMKLDLKIDLDYEFAMLWVFPLSHATKLTTSEYALLAGLSHIGAVRNEVCKKSNPLFAEKEGNNLVISIEEARKHLLNKRKFIPSKGVDYAKSH